MPAINMGAAGGSNAQVAAAGAKAVICSPFSGPTNSPLDARQITGYTSSVSGDNGSAIYANVPTNYSTGAMSTGIGFGLNHVIGLTAPQSIKDAGFTDDYDPGIDYPSGTASVVATLLAIGGGKSTAAVNGIAPTVPWEEQPILGFGNGGSRDAGAGPIFTGFGTKMVTATGSVANGAAVETGWVNRSGGTIATGQSVFGSATAASPVVQ